MIVTLLAFVFAGLLAIFALIQAVVVAVYCRFMRPPLQLESLPASESCAVIMALRGADANLRQNLVAHLKQSHMSYHVHWVVDSERDPAVSVIRALPTEFSHRWTLHVLDLNSDRCSLKCLGLSQVARRLLAGSAPPRFFAFADGDGLVSNDWLVRLLSPMANHQPQSDIAVTTGHRWYNGIPMTRQFASMGAANKSGAVNELCLGAIVRYFWNLGSLPQMHAFRVVWGGSWAIRSQTLRTCGLLESWESSLFEDTQVRTFVERAGHRVVTAPGVLVQAYESASVWSTMRWISRQLLDMRLYHPSFLMTLLHAGTLGVIYLLFAFLLSTGVLSGNGWLVGFVLLAFLVYQLYYVAVWWLLQRTADTCLGALEYSDQSRSETPRFKLKTVCWVGVGLILTQVIYPIAAVRALVTRKVNWRGIMYRIHTPTNIQRLDYQVYSHETKFESRTESA
ncbi:MAG: glycosyltransferase family 2 protein [Planctomycetaceae bacterium]|nr:glycosyltransferase family 2 protein [Planctomycetaceae bacterium]